MDSIDRVVDIATEKSEQHLRDHFTASSGHITGLYAWKTDKVNSTHFFTEFNESGSAAHACADQSPDFAVRRLASSPRLVEKFRAITHGSPDDRTPTPRKPALKARPSSSSLTTASDVDDIGVKRKKTRRAGVTLKLRQAMNTDLDCTSVYASLPTPPESGELAESSSASSHLSLGLNIPDIVLSTRLHRGEDKENHPGPFARDAFPLTPQSPISSVFLPSPLPISSCRSPNPRSVIPPGLPPVQTSIVVPLCGESVSYDLESLEDDPKGIINLLTSAACNLDKWMVVGAFYRRKGNVSAAIEVVSQMIDVMKGYGIEETALKPAFLMLSSCHTELGKRARLPDGRETEASLACFEQSRRWLQNVYGTHVSETEHAARAALVSRFAELNKAAASGASATALVAPVARISTPTAPSAAASATPSSQVLEREVKLLRDRQSMHSAELTKARAAKRKSEDAFEHERSMRRRLERHLDELERQLSRSQKKESSAMEQAMSEVKARQRAEEREGAERRARLKAEEGLREREKDVGEKGLVRPLFEELAGIFQRAAMGDPAVLGTVTAPSRGREQAEPVGGGETLRGSCAGSDTHQSTNQSINDSSTQSQGPSHQEAHQLAAVPSGNEQRTTQTSWETQSVVLYSSAPVVVDLNAQVPLFLRRHPPIPSSNQTFEYNKNMASVQTLPRDVSKLGQEVKLFGKWETQDVEVKDISLTDYIQIRHAVYLPHTAGRYAKKQFKKAQMPIVERLVDSLMMKGRNNGKKLMAVRIVAHAFEIIHLLTEQNPIQVLVDAIVNTGPREDSTRIGSQGTVRRQAVDVSPLRRVNQAISLLTIGTRESAFRNVKSIAECLADELINAAKGSSNSYAIKKKDELERVAKSNR
ncbi:hypothetical protein EW146_g3137 [Bondarzewia mesenterica]|uniref:Small ribosomal subunit protein uS7 domain-containing protein n=1 Tax=Bondarzewia mesenterica TaxID=1095465 RepID=A0A4S4LYX2_9AGAM|nr:hypothetical protein EW146_g3137 [Bondarzewia mesenterica]